MQTSQAADLMLDVDSLSITDQPESQEAYRGENANFAVGISGSNPMTFQWYKNNTAINGASEVRS